MTTETGWIDVESRTVNRWIAGNLAAFGDREALVLLDEAGQASRYGYADIVGRAGRWGSYYQKQAMTRGDRVIVILDHGIDLYCAYLGAVLGGFVPTMFSRPSVKHRREVYFQTVFDLIENADAKLMVCQGELADELDAKLREQGSRVQVLKLEQVFDEVEKHRPCEYADVDATDIAFLQYSSGTTGLKKGVAIAHDALLWQIRRYSQVLGLRGDDVIVSWLPLYHDMGLIACYWLALLTGTRLVAMSPFDWVAKPGRLLQAMSDEGGTLCWQPNFAYEHLVKSVSDDELKGVDLSGVRGLVNCSEPLMAASHARFIEQFSKCGIGGEMLWSCYAMAEHVFAVSGGVAKVDEVEGLSVLSSGPVVEGVALRVVDEDGKEVAAGETGEIVVKSPCLMRGYWGNDEQTQRVMRDGWYWTGDLGYIKDDELYVAGRKDDLIIVAGKNIYPQDIEGIVNDVPGVVPGRCVAVGVDDGRMGTQKLVVIAESDVTDEAEKQVISRAAVEAIDSATMVVADDVRMVERGWLVKSTSGKLSRKENRRRYVAVFGGGQRKARSVGEVYRWAQISDEKLRGMLTRLVGEVSGVDATQVEACAAEGRSFIEAGLLDSLKMVKLVMILEDGFEMTPGRVRGLNVEQLGSLDGLMGCVRGWLNEEATGQPCGESAVVQTVSVRQQKCDDFKRGSRDIDLLILGSSRVQNMSTQVAGEYGFKAYNFSVFSARAEDWYCIYRFVKAHNGNPLKRVLLGVDVEAFTVGAEIDQRLSICKDLEQYLDDSDRMVDEQRKQELAESMAKGQQGARGIRLLKQLRNQAPDRERNFKFAEGTGDFVYVDDDELSRRYNARQPVMLEDVKGCDIEYEMRMGAFARLNPKRLAYFVQLMKQCMADGVRVSCFLTPLHQHLHDHVSARTQYLDRVEEFVNGVKGNVSPLFDLHSFMLASHFGGIDDDFVNGAHVGAANADIMMRKLLEA